MQIAFSTLFKDVLIFFPIPPYLNNLNYCDFPPHFPRALVQHVSRTVLPEARQLHPMQFQQEPREAPEIFAVMQSWQLPVLAAVPSLQDRPQQQQRGRQSLCICRQRELSPRTLASLWLSFTKSDLPPAWGDVAGSELWDYLYIWEVLCCVGRVTEHPRVGCDCWHGMETPRHSLPA